MLIFAKDKNVVLSSAREQSNMDSASVSVSLLDLRLYQEKSRSQASVSQAVDTGAFGAKF